MTGHPRRAYAVALIRRGRQIGEIPHYGSVHWCGLADTDPRKVAAVVVAAESWAIECETLEQRLHDEITVTRQVQQAYEDEQWAAMAARVRKRANSPTWAEIQRRWAS